MKFIDDHRVPSQPYPELREVLQRFAGDFTAELKENLFGIYLVGSLATGDFDLDSDIDFLVVTNTELTEAILQPLVDIQVKIHAMDCYPAQHLEGSFISLSDLCDWGTVGQKNLYYFDNGSTTLEQTNHDNKWHVRWVLRERGITLIGPKPETFLQPVPMNELLNEIITSMHQGMTSFQDEMNRPLGFANSRFGQSFFVLTYCRMLHTLCSGMVQSKKAGAVWARQNMDPRWVRLIDQAWEERQGVRFMEKIHQRAEHSKLTETLEFIHYAVSQIDTITKKPH